MSRKFVFSRSSFLLGYNQLNIPLLSIVVFMNVFMPDLKVHFELFIFLISMILILHCLFRVYDDIRFSYYAKMHSYFGIDDDHWLEMDMEERRGLMVAYHDSISREICLSIIDYNVRLTESSRRTWHSRHVSLLASKLINNLDQKYDC